MNSPSLPVRRAVLVLLASVAFASCSKRPAASTQEAPPTPPKMSIPMAPAPTPEDQTPKKVSLDFANALVAGNADAMSKMAEGTGTRTFAFYADFAGVIYAEHLFETSLKARFGDDTQIPPGIEHIGNLPSMPSNYDNLTEQIDGDKAALVDAGGHPGVRLKKVDGAWKIDLIAADASLSADGVSDLEKQRAQFAIMKRGFTEATAKILDGTYTDSKEALDGLKAAMAGPKEEQK